MDRDWPIRFDLDDVQRAEDRAHALLRSHALPDVAHERGPSSCSGPGRLCEDALHQLGREQVVELHLGVRRLGRLERSSSARDVVAPATTHDADVHPRSRHDSSRARARAGLDDVEQLLLCQIDVRARVMRVDRVVDLLVRPLIGESRTRIESRELKDEEQ
jgi:hypothetical protein